MNESIVNGSTETGKRNNGVNRGNVSDNNNNSSSIHSLLSNSITNSSQVSPWFLTVLTAPRRLLPLTRACQ